MTKLEAKHVDSFQLKKPTDSYPDCAFKGCSRAGRVVLFWSEKTGYGRQERSRICVNHALDLANEVLTEYKFNAH